MEVPVTEWDTENHIVVSLVGYSARNGFTKESFLSWVLWTVLRWALQAETGWSLEC